MKFCPVCFQTYADETFSFCLVDGNVLVDKVSSNQTIDTQAIPTEFLPFKA